ncbi:unnamed protein product [Symbiodinium necroappetens]|uniref:Uncharacterized protein n=1 Tax=Symbiodinium necroappetens TaxID=1628268 RepID=A0A812KX38_9DINO|nr:unnamed protein product [Symbiodinium necroappetens]
MGKGKPLRLNSRAHSCATLYAGQSFMKGQYTKQEPENIEHDLRAAEKRLAELRDKARKIESSDVGTEDPQKVVLASPVVPAARPIATPARAVSSDAQPGSQQLWEEAFPNDRKPDQDDDSQSGAIGPAEVPEATRTKVLSAALESRPTHQPEPADSDDELIMDVDCDLRSNTIRISAKEYKAYVSEEVAERWMEIVIRNIKEGKVVIDSGYYTEAAMKSELKFDKDRVKAVVAYCTANRARRRALTRRDKYQRHIVEYWIDVRTSGSLSRTHQEQFSQFVEIIDDNLSLPPPMLGNETRPCYDEDEYEEDTEDDEEADDKAPTTTPKLKRKRRRGKTPSPKSKLESKKRREKAEAVETALEDIEKIPQVLGEILKIRIKIDNTLDKLKDLKVPRDSKDDAKKLSSCTIHADELMTLHDNLAEIKAENGNGEPSEKTSRITMDEEAEKVSDRLLCSIAAGFVDECRDADPDLAENLRSSNLLREMHRKSETKHESACGRAFKKEGLSCPVPIEKVDVGHSTMHPVLKLKDFLKGLSSCGHLPSLWGSNKAEDRTDVLPKFWRRWKVHDGSHQVFQHHRGCLDVVLPIQLHADEGQTLKKSGVMVVNWQSPIGFGVSTQDDTAAAMSVNFLGSSIATRFLYTVCIKRCYSKKKRYVLDGIFENLADELRDLFYNGVSLKIGDQELTFYAASIGLKGVYEESAKSGFCHLCCAGQEGPLCRVPQSAAKEYMHKFDLFHTLHKGVFAELAASGDFQAQLDSIYNMAREHCQATKTPLHMDNLTRHLIKFPGDYEYPSG